MVQWATQHSHQPSKNTETSKAVSLQQTQKNHATTWSKWYTKMSAWVKLSCQVDNTNQN